MQINIQRRALLITPETPQDVAFIEDTLCLKKQDDWIILKRVAVNINGGIGSIVGLETVSVMTFDSESGDVVDKAVEQQRCDVDNDDSSEGGSSSEGQQ